MIGKALFAISLAVVLGPAMAVTGHAQNPAGLDTAAGTPMAAAMTHLEVVGPGDTLFRVALRHGTTVEALMRSNQLASTGGIVTGQLLKVPSPHGSAAGAVAPSAVVGGARSAAAAGSPASTTVGGFGIGGASSPSPAFTIPPAAAEAVRYPMGRRIVIDLSDQTLTAYDDGAVAGHFVVSTGKPTTPTVLGQYQIYSRYASQDMSGPGYWAPGVPFVQYFWSGYSIHGTYWHNNFGTPVSHGCVNMQTPEAEWLWGWSSIGTPVLVQP